MICLCSCNKDEAVIDIDLITKGGWQLVSAKLNYFNSEGDYYNTDTIIIPIECEKDDYRIFLGNNKYYNYTSTAKCYPNEPDSSEGKWTYNERTRKIDLIDEVSGKTVYKIWKLSTTELYLVMDTTVTKGTDQRHSVKKKEVRRYKNMILK
jgi:hypothetical protein